jgi:hypothetical protein
VHSHIRSVARKLLTARSKKQSLDQQEIQVIVDALAEKTYQHGHAWVVRKLRKLASILIGHEPEEHGLNLCKPGWMTWRSCLNSGLRYGQWVKALSRISGPFLVTIQ